MQVFDCHNADVFLRPARIAPCVIGPKRTETMWDNSIFIPMGSIEVDAVAVRKGVAYQFDVGEFQWRSNDGLCSGINIAAASGGNLLSSGYGPGTEISYAQNEDLIVVNVFSEDEEIE